jgi:hypothetical protein
MNRFIRMVALTGCVFLHPALKGTAADAAKPNLLLIVTDDESWFEHGVYGHSNLKTPHFDRLAEKSIAIPLFTTGC